MQKQQKLIQTEYLTLNEHFNQDMKKRLLIPDVLSIVDRDNLWLNYIEWYADHITELLPYVKEARHGSVQCSKSNYFHIIGVTFPCFSNLQELYLINCQIDNIQLLTFLNMQKIEILQVTGNRITHTKSFNKLNWPNLSRIDIDNNILIRASLSRMRLNNTISQIKMLTQLPNQDIIELAKSSAPNILDIDVGCYGIQIQAETDSIIPSIARKYPQININIRF